MVALIRRVVVVWDECEHVSARKIDVLLPEFRNAYYEKFPESRGSSVSLILLATGSPILKTDKITEFLHRGSFIPHSGRNKDLALVKFCSGGLMDQSERYHYLLDRLRYLQARDGAELTPDENTAVVFITSDTAQEMSDVIREVRSRRMIFRTTFIAIQFKKDPSKAYSRMRICGEILGHELRKRFVEAKTDGIVLNVGAEQ